MFFNPDVGMRKLLVGRGTFGPSSDHKNRYTTGTTGILVNGNTFLCLCGNMVAV